MSSVWAKSETRNGDPPNFRGAYAFAISTYGGFTHGRRVSGRTPELPIGAVDNPFFDDFMNHADAPVAKTQNLISMIHDIRHASLKADSQSKLNIALIRRARNTKNGEFFSGQTAYFIAEIAKTKKKENGLAPE